MKYEWHKQFHGTVFDPRFTAAAEIAGSEHTRAFAVWVAASDFASANQDRGSVRSIDLRILAAGVRLALDEVKRIWAAFIELDMIALDRLVGWAEQQGAKLAKAVSAGTLRTRRYRQRKAEKARQGQSECAQPPDPNPETHDPDEASHASPSVTSGVTVTAEEEEGEALRDQSQVFKKGDEPSGRDAPLGEPPPSEKVVQLSDSDVAQKSKLKAKLKAQRRHKVIRFICARYEGEELERRMNGMQGYDEAHDAQWWFDHCDAERIRANWDDVRDQRRRA